MNKSSLGMKSKNQLIERFLGKKSATDLSTVASSRTMSQLNVPESFTRFDCHPGYEKLIVPQIAAGHLGLRNPFFISHDGSAGAITQIDGKEYINFSSYNYLGLSGHPLVNKAAKDAIDRYGTSASASRLVAGERPIQRELEEALADVYGTQNCIVFVSGHATNVSTIGYLFGPKDLVVHDSLIHNSVLEGIKLSGATRRSFSHNDMNALDTLLSEIRMQFERVLIVVEGHYSMDGDIPDLPTLVEIKRRYQCFLMVDEAHALGVLGKTGKGIHEFYNLSGSDVDIWMGTLSKTLASCGGYICGENALVEHLKYAAPGFVYSVGLAPALAASALAALKIMFNEPERIARLQENGQLFLKLAQENKLNIGTSQGFSIIPAITGSSLKSAKLSGKFFDQQINVQPIIYPAVEEKAARLRFFLSCLHTQTHIEKTVKLLKELR
ncbi:MAG: aminotransferase class I/II-fold pyridoxal phosphate-dependent enzyme [Bacilli bacterium]|nr:aminotransferase class I/II-fold pyridoxal phosphate-dependent enzyme [Bacilli bacterium]